MNLQLRSAASARVSRIESYMVSEKYVKRKIEINVDVLLVYIDLDDDHISWTYYILMVILALYGKRFIYIIYLILLLDVIYTHLTCWSMHANNQYFCFLFQVSENLDFYECLSIWILFIKININNKQHPPGRPLNLKTSLRKNVPTSPLISKSA